MVTYTTLGALQQIARDYVKDNTDRLKYAQYFLASLVGQPKESGKELYPMKTLREMAASQKKSPIKLIEEYSNCYTMALAIEDLTESHKTLGYETFDARKRDKDMIVRGFEPAYLANLYQSIDLTIVHTP